MARFCAAHFAALVAAGCSASSTEPPPPSEFETMANDLGGELASRELLADQHDATHDPVDFWNAVVETASPAVRAARRELVAAEADARAIGPGQAPMVEASHIQNGGGSMRETELMVAFDVAGLVGQGRSGAAKARALARAELARSELAEARNVARRELGAALAELASARELASDLATLQIEAAKSLIRVEALDQRGWLPATEVASARAMAHHVTARREAQETAIAQARATLVRASGLSPDSPRLDDDAFTGWPIVERFAPPDASLRPAPELLARQPSLEVARARLVEAEAEVRIACAERWPALLIGPKARFTADDFLLGGLLRLELPWPSSASAAVDAARARRDEARARLADAFAAAQARQTAALHAARTAKAAADEHARVVDQASARRWIAARARFEVDAALLNDWTMALDQREQAVSAKSAALRDWLQATFELAAARGPDAEPTATPDPEPLR